jgi:hypothetical protein
MEKMSERKPTNEDILHALNEIIKEGEQDKSKMYGYDLPNGTWFVKMKINNDDLWQKIKAGELKGLSIEGYFTDKMEKMSERKPTNEDILHALNEIINENQITNK